MQQRWASITSTKQWVRRQASDHYVHQRQLLNYRSRSAFKLLEILDKFKIKSKYSLDLGSAPGGWSQVLQGFSKVVAIDQTVMEPLKNVDFIHGKIQDESVQDQLNKIKEKLDLITSDMSPSFSGNETVDISRSFELVEIALDQCTRLKKGGTLIVKFFQGDGEVEIKSKLELSFRKVIYFKPKSSRSGSREGYWVCIGYRTQSDSKLP